MASWSKRRRLVYAVIVVILVIGAVGLPVFFYFYKAPTCFDGKQNHGEQGIDCGGPCEKLCPSAFLAADVAWTRIEQVAPKLYNVAAYIVNPNTSGGAADAPYHMALYDNKGMLITDVTGTVTIPPHRNTLAFIPAVPVAERIPSRVLFEFTATPNWLKQEDPLSALVISDKRYTEDSSGSSLQVTISNPSVQPIDHVAVYAVLYDKDGNAVGFSRTVVDRIPAGGSAVAPFTWPLDRNGAVISIEVLPVAE